MARLRFESTPEITVNDESVVFKAASGATAPLMEFKDSSGTVVANIAANGVMNVVSVVASNQSIDFSPTTNGCTGESSIWFSTDVSIVYLKTSYLADDTNE